MPAVKFIERLDLEQNISFPDGHEFCECGSLRNENLLCIPALHNGKAVMFKNYLYRALAHLNKFSLIGLLKFVTLKLRRKTILLSGSCRGCGSCCRKINLEVRGNWVRSIEVFSQVLEDHPEFSRFEIVGRDPQGFLQFSCSWCTADGACRDYDNRLAICRNFPDTSLVFCGGGLPSGCGYRLKAGVPFSRVLDRELRKSR